MPTVPRVGERIKFASVESTYEVTSVTYVTNDISVKEVVVEAQ